MKLVRNAAGRPPAIVKPTHVHTHNSSIIILNLYISVACINSINLCLHVFVHVHTYGHHIDQITVVCMLYWIVRAIIFYIQWSRHFLVLVYMYMCIGCSEERLYHAWCRGSPHTSQISHLLLYPSLRLLVSGLSSQFLPYFPIQPAFEVSTGR